MYLWITTPSINFRFCSWEIYGLAVVEDMWMDYGLGENEVNIMLKEGSIFKQDGRGEGNNPKEEIR